MVMPVLTLKQATKTINNGLDEKKTILNQVDLEIQAGDFITVLGGNGAGKSTLFNSIAGTLMIDSGHVFLKEKEITHLKEEKRAKYISRVFQDPKMGTAPRMTVAENLLIALHRGEKRRFVPRNMNTHLSQFESMCRSIGNGLEKHLQTPVGYLSGGQRQSLSLLMATMTSPDLLLLDEHTAALDPKTSKQLMTLTDKKIKENKLTCLMITHSMEDALIYGNRLLLLENGQIKLDLNTAEKEKLTMSTLLKFFEPTVDYR